MKSILTTSILLALASAPALAAEYEIDLGYDSKYISEGRDNLDKGGIYWANGAAAFDNGITLSAAYGYAADSDVNYDELNVGIEYGFEVGDFSLYASYTRLEFFEDDESDNEWGAGIAYGGLEWFEPFATYVYSTEAEGSFVEVGIQRDFSINEALTFSPYVILGLDYGYASPEHDGANHTAVGATLAYQLNDTWAISAVVEHQKADKDVELDVGNDDGHTWGGVHFTAAF
ncbi:hypothetical protein SAMN04488540_11524 [Ferrimonas sediminum]|uniref:Outer membrane protein beta-barrel domain-containing protein n=1 Tax=Ferrimonas sediminum TaxID=718193 RepID=A0A1G8XG28_9GAMM|nr:hypothetical protein [Ferrimonas sediminum]SDJ89443.1 hypothetical protein SAMN04488540_11524 [Ferrimonas sediminum]